MKTAQVLQTDQSIKQLLLMPDDWQITGVSRNPDTGEIVFYVRGGNSLPVLPVPEGGAAPRVAGRYDLRGIGNLHVAWYPAT